MYNSNKAPVIQVGIEDAGGEQAAPIADSKLQWNARNEILRSRKIMLGSYLHNKSTQKYKQKHLATKTYQTISIRDTKFALHAGDNKYNNNNTLSKKPEKKRPML